MSTEPLRLTVGEHCTLLLSSLNAWSQVSKVLDEETVANVRTAVLKSCLLDRMVHCGEQPSQTPCPVHQGVWSGIYSPWPGYVSHDLRTGGVTPIPLDEVPTMLQDWHDAGCRCYQHRCGCSTGWQPDEHCGCVVADLEAKP